MYMRFRRISRAKTCPVCKSVEAYRVKRAGLRVKVVCRILNLRPYWCPECDTFFLGPRQPGVRRVEERGKLEKSGQEGAYGEQAGGHLH